MHNIYRFLNPTNGKCYIGQSLNPRSRCAQHKHEATETNQDGSFTSETKFSRAIRKYGIEHFIFEILMFGVSSEDIDRLETELIEQHSAVSHGYNILNNGSSPKGFKHSDASKLKMSKARTGKKLSESHRENTRIGMNKPEVLARLSEISKESWRTSADKINAARNKAMQDPDYKQAHRDRMLAFWATEGAYEKMTAPSIGLKRSDEFKEGQRNRNAKRKSVVVDGQRFEFMNDAAKHFGVSRQLIRKWIKSGRAIIVECGPLTTPK